MASTSRDFDPSEKDIDVKSKSQCPTNPDSPEIIVISSSSSSAAESMDEDDKIKPVVKSRRKLVDSPEIEVVSSSSSTSPETPDVYQNIISVELMRILEHHKIHLRIWNNRATPPVPPPVRRNRHTTENEPSSSTLNEIDLESDQSSETEG